MLNPRLNFSDLVNIFIWTETRQAERSIVESNVAESSSTHALWRATANRLLVSRRRFLCFFDINYIVVGTGFAIIRLDLEAPLRPFWASASTW